MVRTKTTASVRALAREAVQAFETFTRPDDEVTRWRLRDGAPEWISALVREAHDAMLPDDYRFETIHGALLAMASMDEDEDLDDVGAAFSDETDDYTGDLLEWLASHGARVGFVDVALADFGVGKEDSITDVIRRGQYTEREQVYGRVLGVLWDRAEEDEGE